MSDLDQVIHGVNVWVVLYRATRAIATDMGDLQAVEGLAASIDKAKLDADDLATFLATAIHMLAQHDR